MIRKLKVGDHVIVPAAVRGIGEEMKAVVTDVEKGVMGSPNFITCLYMDTKVLQDLRRKALAYYDLKQVNEEYKNI